MKSYLGPLLCVLSAAACTTNQPAYAPDETARNEVIAPAVPAEELRASPDGSLEPTRTEAHEHGTGAPVHDQNQVSSAPVVPKADEARPVATDVKVQDPNVAPDNTKVNKRDANASALTPLDQGEGKVDLEITQKIRQAVMGDSSLSFTAKNVKIITRERKVTLRGPVNTSEERTTIQAAAQKVAGATNVDNQLEVKK